MDLLPIASEVRQIARKAGEVIIDIYRHDKNIQIVHKSDDSPLTAADRAANQVICEGLERLAPRFPIISEENKAIPYEQRREYTCFWLVDPLDGTKEFIKRNGEFTVNIALVRHDRPVLGVVYAPDLDELYWAVAGRGAFQEVDGRNQALRAARFRLDQTGLRVVCSRSHLNEDTQRLVDRLESPEMVSRGSALKFLLLAKGEADLYPRLAPTMEWDTGAAQIILEEAGGKVLRADDRKPLSYNKESLLNPHFIAYGWMEAPHEMLL
jgi:3'(2'), 5'-bisphosphate nucleotidase